MDCFVKEFVGRHESSTTLHCIDGIYVVYLKEVDLLSFLILQFPSHEAPFLLGL